MMLILISKVIQVLRRKLKDPSHVILQKERKKGKRVPRKSRRRNKRVPKFITITVHYKPVILQKKKINKYITS